MEREEFLEAVEAIRDYILAGESVFLLGWLLPHGAIEIPAILLAGQAKSLGQTCNVCVYTDGGLAKRVAQHDVGRLPAHARQRSA